LKAADGNLAFDSEEGGLAMGRLQVRSTTRVARLGVALGIAFAMVAPVAARAGASEIIEFDGRFYPCHSGPDEKFWIGGNALHFRGATNHNLWVTGTPLLDGFADNVVNGDINLKTGSGVAHARETLRPEAIDGTWEIQVTVTVAPDGLTAHGSGRGTGDLEGMTMDFRHVGDVALALGENPCSDVPFAAHLLGSIRIPAAQL
jgi:hypothetical protein